MSGSILYSSWDTVRPGDIYILGLNPGGDPNGITSTIRNELDQIKSGQKLHNNYLAEDWSNTERKYRVGHHPLQAHLQILLTSLGYNLEDVCASNLIFLRSHDQNGINLQMVDERNFWDVHEIIIDEVQPKVLFVFGNGAISPYRYLLNRYCHTTDFKPYKDINSGHGAWKCRACNASITDRKRTVIGLPHLSRYRADDKDFIISWIQSKFLS